MRTAWRAVEVTGHQVQLQHSSRWSPTRRGRRQAGWRLGGARAWSGVAQACDPAPARPFPCPAHRQHPPATAAATMASSGIRRPRGPGRSAAGRSACAPSRNAAGWIPGCERLVAKKSARLPVEGAVRPPIQSDTSTTARARKTLVPCCCRFTRIALDRTGSAGKRQRAAANRPGNRTIDIARSFFEGVSDLRPVLLLALLGGVIRGHVLHRRQPGPRQLWQASAAAADPASPLRRLPRRHPQPRAWSPGWCVRDARVSGIAAASVRWTSGVMCGGWGS
jgi:hypothetical protein